jgi:hypothetical protein
VDLGSATDINRVILKWNITAAKDFKIQTSTDGDSWADMYTATNGSSFMVTDQTFPTTTARYVRMYGTQRAPVFTGFRGRVRGPLGSTTQPATQGAALAATQPTRPMRYSLFEFMVLKD